MKVSAVAPERHVIEAPARVFHDQEAVKHAFKAGEFTGDTVVVVRFQGPKANGMPELHSLTPILAVLQDRGLKVALVTDGRMSGASGKVPSAIHVSPEALDGGPLARLRDGDLVRVDAVAGTLDVLTPGVLDRPNVRPDLVANGFGLGRELFAGLPQPRRPGRGRRLAALLTRMMASPAHLSDRHAGGCRPQLRGSGVHKSERAASAGPFAGSARARRRRRARH